MFDFTCKAQNILTNMVKLEIMFNILSVVLVKRNGALMTQRKILSWVRKHRNTEKVSHIVQKSTS